jgi:uncharacterized SAM-binding protein YcdF (DUF218 family)
MPLPFFWLMVTLASVFAIRGRKKTSGRLMVFSVLWLLVISTPFIPDLLVAGLENRYPVYALPGESPCTATETESGASGVNILVLGSGHTNDSRLQATNRLSETALARLTEGIRLQRQIPASLLITSGWSGKRETVPQAEVLAQAALLLGVDSSQVKTQSLPNNTRMEASEYKRLFGDSARLILVTSAAHMPRAVYLFRKAGLEPLPAPTNHLVKKGEKRNPWFWLPSSAHISKMESAIHEYAGLIWYKTGGK